VLTKRQFEEILRKLDLLVKLSALNLVKDRKVREQIKFLYGLGLQPKEIAWILGKTSTHVRVELHKLRKAEKESE